jgi:hypothetical protein
MKIAGIDYSLTSPAICVYEYDVEEEKKEFFSFRECKSYCLTNNKRQLASNIPNIIIEPYPTYSTEQERQDHLSNWSLDILAACSAIYIEGYAYGASDRSTRPIAENMGLLKHKLWKGRLPFTAIPPTVIKKFATSKGNSSKDDMHNAFVKELFTPSNLQELLTPKAKRIINPISDLVDAYFVLKCGLMTTSP